MGTTADGDGDEELSRAERLHEDAVVLDALVADGNTYVDDPEYRDHLAKAGVTAGNFTVGGPGNNFEETVEGVLATRRNVAANDDAYLLVESTADVRRAAETGRTGVVLGFQGADTLGKSLDRLRTVHALGVRVIGLTYNRQNFLGAGCCEPEDAGLSMFGRDAVDLMNDLGVVIDTAHDGDRTTMDVIEHSDDPVIQSHIGARALCDARGRAKTDEQLAAVARNGGVNAITFFPPVIRRDPDSHEVLRATLDDVLDHVDHAVDVAGVDAVGFGADMSDRALDRGTLTDGSNLREWRKTHPEVYGAGSTTTMDPYPEGVDRYPKLPNLTRGLVERGYTDAEVEKILGGNLLRVFEAVWAD